MRIHATIDRGSIARTKQSIARVSRYTGSEAWNMMNRLAGWFAISAHKRTPIGKNRPRKLIKLTGAARRAAGGWPYMVRSFSQSQNKKFARRSAGFADIAVASGKGVNWLFPDKQTAEPYRTILYRGAAKASWLGVLRKLGWGAKAPQPASDTLKTVIFRTNYVIFKRGADVQRIILINKLRYLLNIAPGIEREAMQAAHNRMESIEKRLYNRGVRIAWGAAA